MNMQLKEALPETHDQFHNHGRQDKATTFLVSENGMILVHYQYDIAWFSELVSVHGKACLAGNSCSIAKRHNAVHGC